ncbi:hypothetical protein POL68_30560 [Stigmatella sp. ncwal1]|uniref:Uncharacterized protein n=1 Tax=Stigmatella ashevillensis TaxID=2995309 RepID=A0ABT5DI86_9BACT|nr:hypothetical protein [Stigmatella ashevillena]MDC0712843.1 hypothetical protein [Stigmatella ashevillena]
MSRSRREWWRAVAEAREWLTLGLSYIDAPFEVIVAALKDLERQYAREARTDAERLRLKRLTALDAVDAAFTQLRPWQDFGPWLRRIRRLGFPDLWSRFHIATLYAQSVPNFPEQARDAFAMLADVERRVRRRRKDRQSRQQMLDSIDYARLVAARFLPPETPGT